MRNNGNSWGEASWVVGAGRWRGKKLAIPSKTTTRPTKSIMRGSFFDTIQEKIRGSVFVELFGGSGSMGIEALSRGAFHVYFVEQDPLAIEVLRDNLRRLGAHTEATVIHGNAFVEGPKIVAKLLEEKKRGWFYLDPPFAIRDGMADIYERTQRLIASLDPEAVIKIVVEHDAKVVFPDEIGPYKLLKTRRFGASALSWYAIAE